MNKQPRLFPVLVAASLFLASGPLPAAAQMRAQVAAGSGAVAPIIPIGVSALPAGGSFSPLTPAAGLNGSLAAPNAAPSPLMSIVSSALTVVRQAAASSDGVSIPTPGAAATRVAEEAAAYATPSDQTPNAKPAASEKGIVSRILDTLRRPAAAVSFDGAAEKAPLVSPISLPAPAAASGISDAEVSQHLDEASRMSPAWAINQMIEQYYLKNASRLTVRQVLALASGLIRNDSDSYNKKNTYSRMAIHYVSLTRLSWAELQSVLTELVHTDPNTYYRIVDTYFGSTPSLDLRAAVAVAGAADNAWQTNYLIEKYYQQTKTQLAWEQVKVLLDGLIRNDSGTYNRTSTQNRILRDWEQIAHGKPATISGGMSLREQQPLSLPNGAAADEQPTIPTADLERTQVYAVPGAPGITPTSGLNRVVLEAAPADTDAILRALKARIDGEFAHYGVSSSELRLVHAKRFDDRGELGDTIFFYFNRIKDGLVVNGHNLSFTVMVIDGKPQLVSEPARPLSPIDVNTGTVLTDDEIMGRIAQRVGIPPAEASETFKFYEQKIVYSRGAWHNVKLYIADDLPVMVAVDVVSGLVFLWDNRAGLKNSQAASQKTVGPSSQNDAAIMEATLMMGSKEVVNYGEVEALLPSYVTITQRDDALITVKKVDGSGFTDEELWRLANIAGLMAVWHGDVKMHGNGSIGSPYRVFKELAKRAPAALAQPDTAGVSGKVSGRTVEKGPIMPDSTLANIPLAFLEITIGGKKYVTDKDGKFSLDSGLEVGPEGLELTATLSGPYVRIEDKAGKTLNIKVAITAGDNQVVFNPNSGVNDEVALAQVNGFKTVNRALNYLRQHKLTTERMDKIQLPVRTNVPGAGNAYYTPGNPTENFLRADKNFVNAAYDTVAQHETGHFWDDFTGGIVNGGLSEGWGDILSMFDLNNPIIGEHFLKRARNGVDYIRHGENKYQYNEYDEVHDQGQAWGGFAWKLRKALIEKLGYEEGAAMAEALVMPTMFAKASTIPDAMAQVLVNATKKDGSILHEAEIRAAAKAHGVNLPQAAAPTGPASWLSVKVKSTSIEDVPSGDRGLAPEEVGTETILPTHAEEAKTAAGLVTFSAGRLVRADALSYIRGYLDHFGVTYTIRRIGGGGNGATYELKMTGNRRAIENITKTLQDGNLGYARPSSAVHLNGTEWLDADAQGAVSLLAADGQTPKARAKITFSVGALYRNRVVNELRRALDGVDVKYELKSYGGWLSTDYLLIIEGPQDKVQGYVDAIQRYFKKLEILLR